MAQALEPVPADAGEICFELDRLELTDSGSLEVTGRWFGVRGRRFVRPTLTTVVGGHHRRLLADLAGKPWAAEDGSDWTAVFPWEAEAEPETTVELAVAPDIAVALPPGGGTARLHGDVRRPLERSVAPPGADRELAEARRENERLRSALSERETARVHEAAAVARRDAAVEKLEQLREQLAQAVAGRDAAVAELARAKSERDAAVAERDAAVAALARAKSERDAAVAERDAAVAELARARSEREHALADRNRAIAERAEALEAARDAEAARERAAAETQRMQAAAGALTITPASTQQHRRAAGAGSSSTWLARAAALALLLVALVAFFSVARIL